jgi:hypothetical protein
LQLGIDECKVYPDGLLKLTPQVDFVFLSNLRLLDKAEEYGDTAWQCLKMLKYIDNVGAIDGHQNAEWNNFNKTQSWINISPFSLSNHTLIISFASTKNIIHKMPLYYLMLKLLGYRKC